MVYYHPYIILLLIGLIGISLVGALAVVIVVGIMQLITYILLFIVAKIREKITGKKTNWKDLDLF